MRKIQLLNLIAALKVSSKPGCFAINEVHNGKLSNYKWHFSLAVRNCNCCFLLMLQLEQMPIVFKIPDHFRKFFEFFQNVSKNFEIFLKIFRTFLNTSCGFLKILERFTEVFTNILEDFSKVPIIFKGFRWLSEHFPSFQ